MRKLVGALLLTQVAVGCMLLTLGSLGATATTESSEPPLTTIVEHKEELNMQKVEGTIGNKIAEQVAELPKPKNGKDGKNGTVDYNVVHDIITGQTPKPPVFPEIRENPDTTKTEWRCPGDDLWTTLETTPILAGSCL